MAETAAIWCPDKTVLIPDLAAGCSLADSITAAQWRTGMPGIASCMQVMRPAGAHADAQVVMCEGGVVAGLPLLSAVFRAVAPALSVTQNVEDGTLTHSARALDISLDVIVV